MLRGAAAGRHRTRGSGEPGRRQPGAGNPGRGPGHRRRPADVDVVHAHTWYANLAGHLGGLMGVPTSSLHTPWSRDGLGRRSSWAGLPGVILGGAHRHENAAAIIAVSHGMRADVLDCYPNVDPAKVHVVHNGIDTEQYRPVASTRALERLRGPRGSALCPVRGAHHAAEGHQPLAARRAGLLAGDPACARWRPRRTRRRWGEVAEAVAELNARAGGVYWLDTQLSRDDIIELLSHALLFACPSVYEPLGIVNPEAIACEAPVVASAVGVGNPGGRRRRRDRAARGLPPEDPEAFERRFAAAVNTVADDPETAARMVLAGRERAVTGSSVGTPSPSARWRSTGRRRRRLGLYPAIRLVAGG